jgi:hypothetical protein
LSYSATGPEAQDAGSRRQNALSILFLFVTIFAFAVRFCVAPEMMNQVMEYTTKLGSFYEKLHLGTYAIFLLLPVALLSRPIQLRGHDIRRFKDLLRYSAIMVLLIVLMMALGRSSAAGLILDTYLVAGAAGLIVLSMTPQMRRIVGDAVLWMSLVSAVIGILEFITHTRLQPYDLHEDVFRPTGLADHPLTLGLMGAASIGFVLMTGWKPWLKIAAVGVLFISTATAGARFALLLASAEIVAAVLIVPWTKLTPRHERQAKVAVLLLVLALGVALFAVLAAGGALSRFSSGIVDENFFARTDIYKIFDYVGWREIVFGADLEGIIKIVNEQLKLPFIESAPVYLTFLFGAPVAIGFAIALFWLFLRLLQHVARPAWIGSAVFFAAALSNNTLSSKTPVVAIFLVLIVAYANVVPAKRPTVSPET